MTEEELRRNFKRNISILDVKQDFVLVTHLYRKLKGNIGDKKKIGFCGNIWTRK